MSDTRLARIQALSGVVFATFLLLHLANAALAAPGASTYDEVMGGLRRYYQLPAVEILVVGLGALVHAVCGVLRWRLRRARDRAARAEGRPVPRAPRWLVWHRRSGWFLLLILVGHVLATRGPSLLLDVPVDASYLYFSLGTWPWMFYPYYLALFTGGLYHALQGGSAALRQLGLGTPYGLGTKRPGAARLAFAAAVLVGTLGILALGGITGEADSARHDEWRALFEDYLPFMVTW